MSIGTQSYKGSSPYEEFSKNSFLSNKQFMWYVRLMSDLWSDFFICVWLQMTNDDDGDMMKSSSVANISNSAVFAVFQALW